MSARERKEKSKANLTVVATTESTTPKEGQTMSQTEKEALKARIAQLKEEEKKARAEAKRLREEEKIAKAAAKAAGVTAAFSRQDAVVEFVKSMNPSTLDEIISGSNDLYASRKGTEKANNLREAKAVAVAAIHILAGVGCLILGEDKKYSRK